MKTYQRLPAPDLPRAISVEGKDLIAANRRLRAQCARVIARAEAARGRARAILRYCDALFPKR